MLTTVIGRAARVGALAALLTLAAAGCGAVEVGGDGNGGGNGEGATGGGGGGPERQEQSKVVVAPSEPFSEDESGGASLPGSSIPRIVGDCFADLRNGSYEELEARTERDLQSATDPRSVSVLRLCNAVAELNNGAVLEATRDLDAVEGRLDALPDNSRRQLEVLLLRAQMVAKAQLGQTGRANAYLARAATLAPGEAAGLQQELVQAAETAGQRSTG